MTYNIIAEMEQSTVVAEYTPTEQRSDFYQSEADLEKDFIKRLQAQGYEYVTIHNEQELENNLRKQIELLNDITFTNSEWKQFFRQHLANANQSIEDKTSLIQEVRRVSIKRDDGTTKNITLIDAVRIHENRLQVINQYAEDKGTYKTRYDVTVLVNGFPMVHIELKRRGISIREAFNQIDRYQRDSFWAGSGLFQYVQIFVISNGTHTKYYSNTTRESHIKEQDESGRRRSRKTSNSFEFTSFWADGKNNLIPDLVDFAKTFFNRHTILNILTRYCVFTTDRLLLVMRPYQIAATERILQRIEIANNYRKMGTTEAGGYIWHTTGSGKTLTSFKTALLAAQLPYIDKVLFVVDRKDLDYQTIKEYDRFQKGAANGNTSTAILKMQLEDTTSKIIITTIQKLGVFIRKNPRHPAYKKHIVFVFDECHRSNFGKLHTAIIQSFKQWHLFGFTGTPIFSDNASTGGNPVLKTTVQAFGDQLHKYTIVNAINDNNVLPFRIDYVNTVKAKDGIADFKIESIDNDKILNAPQRIEAIVRYILENFDRKTKRYYGYSFKGKIVSGFNSILATASISMARAYWKAFKKQMDNVHKHLSIATIFSFAPNGDAFDFLTQEESFDTSKLPKSDRDFLEEAIKDYNGRFHTNFDTSPAKFDNYYKNVSQKLKEREIDLLIVVNMFLTGFDATTLNTLWVDKNLRYHGLIQAFSRTNRILNSVKTFGNIVCFRDLQKNTNDAIALFGNDNARGIVLLRTFAEYYSGYDETKPDGSIVHREGYEEMIVELQKSFPLGDNGVMGEQEKKRFLNLFSAILRCRNILSSFDDFKGKEILTDAEFQDYQSKYIDAKPPRKERLKEDVTDDIVFETELIRQIEVNIDYILMLVEKYQGTYCKDKEILVKISKAVNSSIDLRNKKDLIDEFVNRVGVDTKIQEEWKAFVAEKREEELSNLIASENLKNERARKFINDAFSSGELRTIGTEIQEILPPSSPFDKDASLKKATIIERIKSFFEKFIGLFV